MRPTQTTVHETDGSSFNAVRLIVGRTLIIRPSQNGSYLILQALIDLKSLTAVSDIWVNHYSGNAWLKMELFVASPFEAEPVWSTMVNTSQVNGKTVSEPPVCNGWGWNQKWCGWNISSTEAASPKGQCLLHLAFVM